MRGSPSAYGVFVPVQDFGSVEAFAVFAGDLAFVALTGAFALSGAFAVVFAAAVAF